MRARACARASARLRARTPACLRACVPARVRAYARACPRVFVLRRHVGAVGAFSKLGRSQVGQAHAATRRPREHCDEHSRC
eukprot:2472327-Alexandrium_andersonii.AAC.1